MDGVRTAAGWVRELQGRWLGHWGRLEVGERSSVAALRPYGPCGSWMRGMAREYAAGSRGPGWHEFAGKLGQLHWLRRGVEWLAAGPWRE